MDKKEPLDVSNFDKINKIYHNDPYGNFILNLIYNCIILSSMIGVNGTKVLTVGLQIISKKLYDIIDFYTGIGNKDKSKMH